MSIKIYSAAVIKKDTNVRLISFGFFTTKELLKENVNKTLIELNEKPDNVYVIIKTDRLFS